MCDAAKTSTLLSFFLTGKMTSSLPTLQSYYDVISIRVDSVNDTK